VPGSGGASSGCADGVGVLADGSIVGAGAGLPTEACSAEAGAAGFAAKRCHSQNPTATTVMAAASHRTGRTVRLRPGI